MNTGELNKQIAEVLAGRNLTIGVCESCTAGMLGAALTSIPGSSKYFLGGIIAYSDDVKERVVGVKRRTLKIHGAVSGQAAREMALGVRRMMHSDIAVAITGIAGPGGGSREKPVGTVFIAVEKRNTITVRKFRFKGKRQTVRRSACTKALVMLWEALND